MNWKKLLITLLPHVLLLGVLITAVFLPIYINNHPESGLYFIKPHGLYGDYNYYLAIINQGKVQSYEIDPYTTENTKPSYLHIYYLVLGKFSLITGLSVVAMYYLGMIVPLLIFYLYTYLLTSLFFKGSMRWLVIMVIFFVSPLPQMNIILFGKTIWIGSYWWTKTDPYSRITLVPHHFFAIAACVAASYYYLLFTKTGKISCAVYCAIFSLLGNIVFITTGMIFFTSVVITFLATYAFARFRMKMNRIVVTGYVLIAASFFLPLVFAGYQLTSIGFPWSENIRWEQTFNPELSPMTLPIYAVSFIVLLPLVLVSIIKIVRRFEPALLYILSMLFVPWILWFPVVWGFLPLGKIRLVYSAPFVFAGIAAVIGMLYILQAIQKPGCKKVFLLGFGIVFAANSAIGVYHYWAPNLHPLPNYTNYYLKNSYIDLFSYINAHTKTGEHMFSDLTTGSLLPSFTHTISFVGHEVSTYNFVLKEWQADQFFYGLMSVQDIQDLFRQHQISYVVWDSCSYGDKSEPYQRIMIKIYHNDCFSVYSVGDKIPNQGLVY
jgi:hypothetical protein